MFRSDRGTNFVGASDELRMNVVNVQDPELKKYLFASNSTWMFNPPHSSHMGGVWERMIGVRRKILDSMLLGEKKGLTNDVITTLMAEVCSVLNSRSITTISTDPEDPVLLRPNMLLTQKPSDTTMDYEVTA